MTEWSSATSTRLRSAMASSRLGVGRLAAKRVELKLASGTTVAGSPTGSDRTSRIVVPRPTSLSIVTSPPMSDGEPLADHQPEPGAAVALRRRRLGLRELLEQPALLLVGEPDAGVDDGELDGLHPVAGSLTTRASPRSPPTSVNFTALDRKLLRIWRMRSGSPTWAGGELRSSQCARQPQPLGRGGVDERRDGGLDDVAQREGRRRRSRACRPRSSRSRACRR